MIGSHLFKTQTIYDSRASQFIFLILTSTCSERTSNSDTDSQFSFELCKNIHTIESYIEVTSRYSKKAADSTLCRACRSKLPSDWSWMTWTKTFRKIPAATGAIYWFMVIDAFFKHFLVSSFLVSLHFFQNKQITIQGEHFQTIRGCMVRITL